MVKLVDAIQRIVVYQVMSGLEIEGFLDFGVRRYQKMEDYDGRDEKV